jgi:hypothetical protein
VASVIWLAIALVLAAMTVAGVVFVRKRAKRTVTVLVAPDLAKRVEVAARAFTAASPWQPASAPDAPETAAAIEAALIAREPKRALELAETALAAGSNSPAHRVWLAWALCANGQPGAAADQLVVAGERSQPALALYVAARAEHLRFEHASGAIGAMPPIVTTGDLAVVTLARGRGGATWLTGATEAQLSAAEVKAAVAEHREITGRCLERALAALAKQPGFVDAAYLVARLAVKAGLVDAAAAMFDAIAPRIGGRPDTEALERDRRDLADPTGAVANAKIKPASATSKRSRSLKVL